MKEIEDLIKKAQRFLRTAEITLDDCDYDSCVSRCYYAMFFMAEAMLLSKGISASSHKGVISLFGKHFIKTNILKEELGKALRRAYDLRQKGDYATGFTVSDREAKKSLETAKRFVAEAEKYLKSQTE